MRRRALAGLDPRRLRLVLAFFFLALALPSGILIYQAWGRLKWEAFYQYRTLAEELVARIDGRLAALIAKEEARSFGDYAFLVVAGDPAANFLQPSPLSAMPDAAGFPGLLGHFQVDADGRFSTPLLPASASLAASYGISSSQLAERRALQERILGILSRNRLVEPEVARGQKGDPARREAAARAFESPYPAAAYAAPVPAPAAEGGGARLEAPAGENEDVRHRQAWESGGSGRAADAADQTLISREKVASQAAFDRLDEVDEQRTRERPPAALGTVEDLELGLRYQRKPGEEGAASAAAEAKGATPERAQRKERSLLLEPDQAGSLAEEQAAAGSSRALRIGIFESELDPFRLALLESGHLVLYRKVWRDGERSIQGALVAQRPFLEGIIAAAFRDTVLSRMSDLAVAYRGAVLAAFSAKSGRGVLASAEELAGDLLHRARLSTPASDLELIFSIRRLPAGPGARVLGWTAATLVLVLCGGFLALDLLGRKQIELARQRQDFVSAVSHELKTPLTSIRMYAEMLREGWADEGRRGTYYAFICEESERLTRLIENVLQLARLTRNEVRVVPRTVRVADLTAVIGPKLASLTERGGFALDLDCAASAEVLICVDEDFLTQILLNLVDNAVKFAKNAERKEVRIACRTDKTGPRMQWLEIAVRDYGPGVPRDQMKKIFKLFYRSGNELTRETLGTGIGLALVRELTLAMGGRVDLVNADPGAEFRLRFAIVDA